MPPGPVVGKRPGLQQSQLQEVRLFIVPAALCAALGKLEQSGEGGGPQGVTVQTDATETRGQPGRQKAGSGQGTCGGGGSPLLSCDDTSCDSHSEA